MTIERGLNIGGLRIKLVFESEDVETHSVMSGNTPQFEQLASDVRDFAADMLKTMTYQEAPRKL